MVITFKQIRNIIFSVLSKVIKEMNSVLSIILAQNDLIYIIIAMSLLVGVEAKWTWNSEMQKEYDEYVKKVAADELLKKQIDFTPVVNASSCILIVSILYMLFEWYVTDKHLVKFLNVVIYLRNKLSVFIREYIIFRVTCSIIYIIDLVINFFTFGVYDWIGLTFTNNSVLVYLSVLIIRFVIFYIFGHTSVYNKILQIEVEIKEYVFGSYLEGLCSDHTTQQHVVINGTDYSYTTEEVNRDDNINKEFLVLLRGIKQSGEQGIIHNRSRFEEIDCTPNSEHITKDAFWHSLGYNYTKKVDHTINNAITIQTNLFGDVELSRANRSIFINFKPLEPNFSSNNNSWSFDGSFYNINIGNKTVKSSNVIIPEHLHVADRQTGADLFQVIQNVVQSEHYLVIKILLIIQWLIGFKKQITSYYTHSKRYGNFVVTTLIKMRVASSSELSREIQTSNGFLNSESMVKTIAEGKVWGLNRGEKFVFGLAGGHVSHIIDTEVYDTAVSQLRSDPKLSNSTIQRLLCQCGYDMTTGIKMLYYFRAIIGADLEITPDYYGYTIHSTNTILESTNDLKGGVRAMFPPIVTAPGAVAASDVMNDINTLHGRILAVNQCKTDFSSKMNKYAREFAKLIVLERDMYTGVLLTDEEYLDTLDNDIKRQRYRQYVEQAVPYFSEVVSAFQKGEVYGGVGNPRNISAVNAGVLMNLARFTIAFKKNILSKLKWYCPQLTPKEIAEKVRDLCSGEDVIETDMSRYDGTISYWLRYKVEHLCYNRYFREEYADELLSYFTDEMFGEGVTKHNLFYHCAGTRLSGSPFTTDGNTLVNAFMFFVTQRKLGYSLDDIYYEWYGEDKCPFLAYGDDGLCVLDGKVVDETAVEMGLKLKVLDRKTTDYAGFLGRHFLNPKFSTDSIQDPARILPKIHLTFSTPIPDEVAIVNKLRSFSYTDGKTPIIRSLLKLAERSYNVTLNKLDRRRETLLEKYDRALTRDKRYIFSNDESECWQQTDDVEDKLKRLSDSLGVTIEEILEYETYLDSLQHIKDIKRQLQLKPIEIKMTSSVNGEYVKTTDEQVDINIRDGKVKIVDKFKCTNLSKQQNKHVKELSREAEEAVEDPIRLFLNQCVPISDKQFKKLLKSKRGGDFRYYLKLVTAAVVSEMYTENEVNDVINEIVTDQTHPFYDFDVRRLHAAVQNRRALLKQSKQTINNSNNRNKKIHNKLKQLTDNKEQPARAQDTVLDKNAASADQVVNKNQSRNKKKFYNNKRNFYKRNYKQPRLNRQQQN